KRTLTFTPYSADEALAMIVTNKLTKHQYLNIRLGAKVRGVNLYPSYHKIREVKIECYP
ncbi:hypothetical protein EAI_03569, partial [Harpegnathos saltator]